MECRINFLTHLAFQLLWMGLACTGLPLSLIHILLDGRRIYC